MKMKRVFWLLSAVTLMCAARQTQAQVNSGPRPLVKDPDAFLAAEKARSKQGDAFRRQAEEMISKGNLTAAVPLLLQSLQADDNSGARIYLADIYIRWNRPKDVLEMLRPIVYPPNNISYSDGQDITTRMKYVLALLDTKEWPEAATLYEQSVSLHTQSQGLLKWYMKGYGIGAGDQEHTLAIAHFSPEAEDVPGLRAQAHLILGTRSTSFLTLEKLEDTLLPYQLDHVQQALKINPRSQEAQFIQGRLLMEMKRYAEARAVFSRLAQTSPREAQAEINATVARMDLREKTERDNQRAWERRQKAQAANSQTPPRQ